MASGPLSDFRWGWDEAAFSAVNGLGSGFLDAVFVAASSRTFGIAAMAALGLWVLAVHRRRALWPLLHLGVAVAVTDGLGARVLKPWIGRMRPSFALPPDAVRVLLPAADVGSMPSLHAANAFAVATVVTLAVPRAGLLAFPLAVLVAVSRVGVGVHWPSDVLAGAVMGAVVGGGVVAVGRAGVRRWTAARSSRVDGSARAR